MRKYAVSAAQFLLVSLVFLPDAGEPKFNTF